MVKRGEKRSNVGGQGPGRLSQFGRSRETTGRGAIRATGWRRHHFPGKKTWKSNFSKN